MDSTIVPRKRGRPKKSLDIQESDSPDDISKRKKSTTAKKTSQTKRTSSKPKSAKAVHELSTKVKEKLRPLAPASSVSMIKQSRILQEVALSQTSTESGDKQSSPASISTIPEFHAQADNKPVAQTPISSSPAPAISKSIPPISPRSLNAFAVSSLSAQAHPSRPAPIIKNEQLPPNYKSVARRVTIAITVLPVAIVTGWVLYDRCE